jgi:hypothetical protein
VGMTLCRAAIHTKWSTSHRSRRPGRDWRNRKPSRMVWWRVAAWSPLTPLRPLYPRPVRIQPRLHRLTWNTERPLILLSRSQLPACERLIRRWFSPHELPSLVEAIFSSNGAGDTIRSLVGDDAQTFVDVIDEACPTSAHHGSVNWN